VKRWQGEIHNYSEELPPMKKLTLDGDIKVFTFAPPANFNPFTASAAELEKSGFPPIPDDPQHRARYEQVFNQIKNKLHYIEPTFRVNADRQHGPRHRAGGGHAAAAEVGAGTETSGNWSGGVVYAPAGQSFKWVEGDWIVPDVGAPTQGKWYYCASWIGIDASSVRFSKAEAPSHATSIPGGNGIQPPKCRLPTSPSALAT
jgi:hypothetical protein